MGGSSEELPVLGPELGAFLSVLLTEDVEKVTMTARRITS